MSEKHPTENATALIVGGEVKTVGLAVAGQLFVFSPSQMNFLLNLQKLKSVTAAAISVDRTEEWGKKFLASRKFREYFNAKMEEFSIKNGLTAEYLIRWGKEAMEGKREWHEGLCVCGYVSRFNNYEFAEGQNDDLVVGVKCKACFEPIDIQYKSEAFKPDRQQMVAYQELKATIIPKIERTHHTYENISIEFESSEEAQ